MNVSEEVLGNRTQESLGKTTGHGSISMTSGEVSDEALRFTGGIYDEKIPGSSGEDLRKFCW